MIEQLPAERLPENVQMHLGDIRARLNPKDIGWHPFVIDPMPQAP